jgi:hypothetical protein
MRYIPVGGEAQFDRFAISIKFVTAERKAIPNAARNIPPPLCSIIKRKTTRETETTEELIKNRKIKHQKGSMFLQINEVV